MSAGGAGEAPLFAGKIHGVRGWSFADGRLGAAVAGRDWATRGKPTRARCNRRRTHRSPVKDCSCGLYATHPWAAEPLGEVTGVVEAWGRVEVHAGGFRAQYARPVVLFAFSDSTTLEASRDISRLAEVHACEVVELGSAEEVGAFCADRGWGLPRSVVRELVGAEPEAEAPTAPRRRAARGTGVGERLADAAGLALAIPAMLFIAALYVAVYGGMGLALVGGLTGWDPLGLDTESEPAPLARAEGVRVAEEWVLPADGDQPATYVARLVNPSGDSAVWARPALRVRAGDERRRVGRREVAWPAMVPARGEALVVQPLGDREWSDARVRAGPVLAREAARPPRAPARMRVRVARRGRGCAVVANVKARTALPRLVTWQLPVGRDGEPLTLLRHVMRDVPAGSSRRVLDRYRRCPGRMPEVRVFPAFGAGQLVG